MISENFLILGALIQFAGSLSYFIDTLKGKTQPNRVTWLLWAIVPGIAFVAQIQQSVGLPALLTLVIVLSAMLIFMASFFNKKAVWKLGVFDYVCGALAVLAIVLWQLTNNANLAIMLSIIGDLFAAVPTIVKSYKYPKTENYKEPLSSIIYGGITLLALQQWGFEYYAIAVYVVLLNLLTFYLIALRPRLITSKS